MLWERVERVGAVAGGAGEGKGEGGELGEEEGGELGEEDEEEERGKRAELGGGGMG